MGGHSLRRKSAVEGENSNFDGKLIRVNSVDVKSFSLSVHFQCCSIKAIVFGSKIGPKIRIDSKMGYLNWSRAIGN